MNEIKIEQLECLLNEMDEAIEEMVIYFDKNPHEFTEGASILINEMEDERNSLEEIILKLDED